MINFKTNGAMIFSEPTASREPPCRLSCGDNERDGEGAEICIGNGQVKGQ